MSVNKLPSEILQWIFNILVGKPGRHPPYVDDGPAIQEVLCGVCRIWRRIVLDDPLLWNTIHFPITERGIKRTKLFLQRSATAPIDIIITSPKLPVAKAYISEFSELIIAESHRWRAVEVETIVNMAGKPIWAGQVPMLKELVINNPEAKDTERVPRSRRPHLPNGIRILAIVRFALGWHQWNCLSITHLSLGPFGPLGQAPTPEELCGILGALSDTICSLTVKGRWRLESRHGTVFNGPVTLKVLTVFITGTSWEPYLEDILRGCHFPALQHLEVHLPATLPPALVSVLSHKPELFISVKRLSIGLIGDARTFTGQLLHRAFSQLDHVQLSPGTLLYPPLSAFLSTSWGCMTRLDISGAVLSDVKELLSKRLQNYPTPLGELRLSVAYPPLCRVDYDWIKSNVGSFGVLRVASRPGHLLTRYERERTFHEELLQ